MASIALYLVVALILVKLTNAWDFDAALVAVIVAALILVVSLVLRPSWKRWRQRRKAFKEEISSVYEQRRAKQECGFGFRCPAVLQGEETVCPVFQLTPH
jgi:ABC-type nickel/cobalt efflux system permease component RcnA